MILTRCLAVLMTLVLALSSTIPQGWMPAAGSDGKVLLVICTTDGPSERWIDLGDTHPAHDETDSRMPCPFAATPDVEFDHPTTLALTLAAPMRARWDQADFTHRSAGMHWRYDARGPPALS